jgi:hypothetical protein
VDAAFDRSPPVTDRPGIGKLAAANTAGDIAAPVRKG